jgi:hypothetical protein
MLITMCHVLLLVQESADPRPVLCACCHSLMRGILIWQLCAYMGLS